MSVLRLCPFREEITTIGSLHATIQWHRTTNYIPIGPIAPGAEVPAV
jgi:hypothetical protein